MIEKYKEEAEKNPEKYFQFKDLAIAFAKQEIAERGVKLNLNEKAEEFLMQAFFENKEEKYAGHVLFELHTISKEKLTANERLLVDLEFKRCTEIKAFYEKYNLVLEKIKLENGHKHHFESNGVVYQIDKPTGTFVEYKEICLNRTRYDFEIAEGKRSASLSMKDAQALGYEVKGK